MQKAYNIVTDIIEYIYCKQFNDLRKDISK